MDPKVTQIFPSLRRAGRMPTEQEIAARWESSRLVRIHAAVRASSWAYTHRQENTHSDGRTPRHALHPANLGHYGCSVLGCRLGLSEDERFVISTGANFKLRPGDGELVQFHPRLGVKLCAEPEAVIGAISHPLKCWSVYGLTLFSDNMQREDVSGKFCHVQQPCADCRDFLSRFLLPEAPVTLVRHLLPCDLDPSQEVVPDPCGRPLLVEEWTFGEMCAHHGRMSGKRPLEGWERKPFKHRT